jgi:hypothetical protein
VWICSIDKQMCYIVGFHFCCAFPVKTLHFWFTPTFIAIAY